MSEDTPNMANLSNDEPQPLIDWRSIEENRKVFQKLLEDLDHLLESLRARMNESASDEDATSSSPPCLRDQDSCLVEGQDEAAKKPQFLPKWPPGRSPGNTGQRRCEGEKEDRKQEEDFQTRCEDNDGIQKGKDGQWSVSDVKEDPESSQFLLRWPPEGSVLVQSGGAEPHHS